MGMLSGLSEGRQAQLRLWWQRSVVIGAVGLFILLGTLALTFDRLFLSGDTLQLETGDVAARDILAPRSLVYNSDVLTEQARQDAITRVQPVYDPSPDVTRQQIRLAVAVTDYIGEIRHDIYASPRQKTDDLSALEPVSLTGALWLDVIELPENRWELISGDVYNLVEDTMRTDIRPDTVDAVRNNLVNRVASRYSNNESDIIVAIVEDLIQPNTFYNEETTQLRQTEAAARVTIQERRFEEGQLIVRAGTIVTALDVEALRQFGFLQQEEVRIQSILGGVLAMTLTLALMAVYLNYAYPHVLLDRRMLTLVATLFLFFLFLIHLFGSGGVDQPYLYPAAALAILLTNLIGAEMAITTAGLLAVLIGLTQRDDLALDMAGLTLVGSVVGVLSIRRVERLNNYFVAGSLIGLANMVAVLAFALTAEEVPSFFTLLSRTLLAGGNGLFAAVLALLGLYAVTSLLNLTTSLKLIELGDPQNPLLQRLLREAPGTYQHSLQVVNLSGLAAEAIGANASLVRVAAMYHDVGKMLNPFYFTENTTPGMTPHEDLDDPFQSAKVIIGHVIEGERLAKRYNLPARIRDFILEHHGTTQVLYFYNQALEKAESTGETVDIEEFTYPGPAPRSREAAIMMLADGCESATRSRRPSGKEDIEEVVNTIFELRLSEGQLDNSGLTLNDLKKIRHIFIETLQAMYHPRIAYKMREKPANPKPQLTSGIVKNLETGEAKAKTQTGQVIKVAAESAPPAEKPAQRDEKDIQAASEDAPSPEWFDEGEASQVMPPPSREKRLDQAFKEGGDTPPETPPQEDQPADE